MIRTGLIWTVLTLLAMAGIYLYMLAALPTDGRIPIHWTSNGSPDRFTDRDGALRALLSLPITAIVLSLLFALLPRLEPRQSHLRRSSSVFLVGWIGSNLIMLAVMALMAASMIGVIEPSIGGGTAERIIAVLSCVFIVVLGNFLPKTRSSYFVGIRTPWTLSSEHTWQKTHRLGGKLLVAAGLVGLPAAIVGQTAAIMLLGIWLSVAATVCLAAYSYVVWRTAPDRNDDTDFVS